MCVCVYLFVYLFVCLLACLLVGVCFGRVEWSRDAANFVMKPSHFRRLRHVFCAYAARAGSRYVCLCVFLCVCVCVYVCMCACGRVFMMCFALTPQVPAVGCVFLCAFVCMCLNVYVYVCGGVSL